MNFFFFFFFFRKHVFHHCSFVISKIIEKDDTDL